MKGIELLLALFNPGRYLTERTNAGWHGVQRSIHHVVEFISPDRHPHPGAIHGDKILARRAWPKTGKPSHRHGKTNHERVVAGRAQRMGISVTAYERGDWRFHETR